MFVLFSQICFIYYPMKNKSFQHALKSLYLMCYATVSSTIFWRQQNHTFSKWIPIDRVLELILKKKNLFFFKIEFIFI